MKTFIAITEKGQALRYKSKENYNYEPIKLAKGDSLIANAIISKDNKYVTIVTGEEYWSNIEISSIPFLPIGSSGVKILKLTPKTGSILIARFVKWIE